MRQGTLVRATVHAGRASGAGIRDRRGLAMLRMVQARGAEGKASGARSRASCCWHPLARRIPVPYTDRLRIGIRSDTVPERIYTSDKAGSLEALEETPFASEGELQTLIAEHPELIDGEQIRPGDARRWILVTREKGIAASAGGGAVWAVDHLIVDQDAVPTLVEVKRGSNPEVRRTVVGQLLEYAAHASESWSAAELREAFEHDATARGRDPGDELATLLGTDGEPRRRSFGTTYPRIWQRDACACCSSRTRYLILWPAWPRSSMPRWRASRLWPSRSSGSTGSPRRRLCLASLAEHRPRRVGGDQGRG